MTKYYIDASYDETKVRKYLDDNVIEGDAVYIVFNNTNKINALDNISMKTFSLCDVKLIPVYYNDTIMILSEIFNHIVEDIVKNNEVSGPYYVLADKDIYEQDIYSLNEEYPYVSISLINTARTKRDKKHEELLKQFLNNKPVSDKMFDYIEEEEEPFPDRAYIAKIDPESSISEQNIQLRSTLSKKFESMGYTDHEIKAILKGRNHNQLLNIINHKMDDRLREVLRRRMQKAEIEESRMEQIIKDLETLDLVYVIEIKR